MTEQPAVCQVTVTVGDREAALTLARSAVESRLAACAQVGGPIRSVYRWQGVIEESEEWTVVFKTTLDRYPSLEEFVNLHHSYDVPEILCTPVIGGNPDYLAWVGESIRISRTGPPSLGGDPGRSVAGGPA